MMNTNGYDNFPAEPMLPDGLGALLFFGGSFDPVHRAHVSLAEYAARQFGCDHILFVPANRSPHKMGDGAGPAAGIDRYNMLKLALADHDNVSVSDYEISHPAPSYTVNTLERLRGFLGDEVKIYLLMGSDQALTFANWYRADRILELAQPIVLLRPPHSNWESVIEDGIDTTIFTKDMLVCAPLDEAASTKIRGEYEGKCGDKYGGGIESGCSAFLHPGVREYIEEHHLYEGGS